MTDYDRSGREIIGGPALQTLRHRAEMRTKATLLGPEIETDEEAVKREWVAGKADRKALAGLTLQLAVAWRLAITLPSLRESLPPGDDLTPTYNVLLNELG